MGKELADDPEVQEKIRAGLLPPIPTAATASAREPQAVSAGTIDSDAAANVGSAGTASRGASSRAGLGAR